MATIEQDNEVRSQLKGELEGLSGITATGLARKDLGQDLNFESGVIFFSRTLRLFQGLSESDLQDIPFQKMSQLLTVAKQAGGFFRQIQEFSLQKYPNTPIETRNQFIAQVRDSYDVMFDNIAPVLAFTVRKGTDFERLEEQAKEKLRLIDVLSAEHKEALTKARSDAEQLVTEVRRIAAESGVSQHSIHFKQEADQHGGSARRWLTATIVLAIATVVIAASLGYVYFKLVPALSAAQNLQLAISKIIVVSVLLTATLWAGRTYRAHRHNAVINRHRQNALTTFQAFAKAASDDQTKNAVLLQATQCIFSPQQTVYVSGEAEASGIPQVLEIVRNLGPSK